MPAPIRIATFNCENLFNRPKIFGPGGQRSTELLGYVAQLQDQLKNAVFDHQAIEDLKRKLRGYRSATGCRASSSSRSPEAARGRERAIRGPVVLSKR